MTAEDYRRVTEVTYLGYVHGTLAALRHMLPRDRGMIVQVGSALCYRGIPLQSAYCAAKHAIQGFTESLRCELIRAQPWACRIALSCGLSAEARPSRKRARQLRRALNRDPR